MADLLDIEQFSDDNKFVIVGEIDECKAVFLREKSPGNNLLKGKRFYYGLTGLNMLKSIKEIFKQPMNIMSALRILPIL